ncbi:tRNA (adenosine(37)-N6)-threonylcarbamoyltransferase complex dimerization subunit type 1 TsaB [Ralstonia pseudosolanacearum]|uniref:tRNA (Adenosine(37)-N6)-threonylcarbamoyltransferase complex dimerization subunit type 1 TsaB n=1 Tax=Ralstonia solanacearum TaxID=305 RepID=A0AA92K254_RALSL|nr:tRNA (adenosine(37)-N6)-threonylcarbamoyltransferase complex dimerization subunit type 1 TsaB [Ralstonia pseudosolanacearum]QOK96923.1 tRNA (adenosine(37)-N6)-threonylcarbamoyltransferase complex dimerization subunit type 1 TsaB [Ralstonia pseudosolanacearum]
MPWILAFDTSTEFCSVALGDGTRTLFRHEHTGARSSSRVLPAAGELLAEAGIALSDCAAIAFGAGPGSFTGLRTACGVAQGLAFGAGLPVVPVNSLMACAEQTRVALPAGTAVTVALDARMDECYWASFVPVAEDAAGWHALSAVQVSAPQAVAPPQQPYWLAGNAAVVFGDRLAAATGAAAVLPDVAPHAREIVTLGLRLLAAGHTVRPEEAAPLYVRDKVALTIEERQAVQQAKAAAGAQA